MADFGPGPPPVVLPTALPPTGPAGGDLGGSYPNPTVVKPAVTSVGLALPAELTVTGSPVTGAGTLTAAWASQVQNRVFATPAGGGPPAFRKLLGPDLPLPTAAALGGVQSAGPVANQWINSISVAGVPALSQPSTANLSDRDAAFTALTPTLSVVTIGDGVFSGVTATGQYRRLGFLVWFWISVRFTLTYTTASGQLQIGGFPIAPLNNSFCLFALNPLVSPSDHLIGQFNGGNLQGLITTTGQIGNYWGPGPSFGLVSGTAYNIYAGGVYATNF